MLKPLQQDLLKSIDELFESKVLIDAINLERYFEQNPNYQNALKENRIVSLFGYDDKDWLKKSIKNNIAVISHICDGNAQVNYPGMYQIPEIFYDSFDLYVPPFQPYTDKIQNLMDRSFETGLLKAWKTFYSNEAKKFYGTKTNSNIKDEKEVLDFEALIPFFLILVIGFSLSLLVLFFEIFHNDFWSQLPKNYFKLKLRKIFYKKPRTKGGAVNFRKVKKCKQSQLKKN